MIHPLGGLTGRRLLVLGAGHYQLPLIERAKALGCHVITADYLPQNPGHRLADEALEISTVDQEEILAAARELKIDGIVTYGSDVSAPTVGYVAEELELPGNPAAAGRDLQRKDRVRRLQREIGLPHPLFAAADDPAELADELSEAAVPWPVLVKPADASGSKGQVEVPGMDQLPEAFAHAVAFSRCGFVVAEQLLHSDLLELVGDVWIRGGQLAFRGYGHNYFRADVRARVPAGEVVPGFFGSEVKADLDRQLQTLIDAAGLRTGCLNFDALWVDGRVHILDIGLRNGGNYFCDVIELATGFDLTEVAICSALGVELPLPPRRPESPRWAMSYILGAAGAGVFDGIEVSGALRSHVVREIVFVEPGDPVQPFHRGDHSLGVVLMVLPNREAILEVLSRVSEEVTVRVR